MAKFNLYISGGVHTSSNKGRKEEIEERLPNIDVVFLEGYDPGGVPISVRGLNALATPLLLLSISIYFLALDIYEIGSGHGDGNLAKEIAHDHDVEVEKVDLDPHLVIAEDRLIWGVMHYLPLAMVMVIAKNSELVGSEFFYIFPLTELSFLVFIGMTLGVFFLGLYMVAGFSRRNIHMVDQMMAFNDETDIDQAPIITGKRHVNGIERLCEMVDIEIVNREEKEGQAVRNSGS